jgi:hypothetical protein
MVMVGNADVRLHYEGYETLCSAEATSAATSASDTKCCRLGSLSLKHPGYIVTSGHLDGTPKTRGALITCRRLACHILGLEPSSAENFSISAFSETSDWSIVFEFPENPI